MLAEGESDALALRAAYAARRLAGRRVVVLGVPGATMWRTAWVRWVERFGRVFVLGDGDDAGRALIADVAASLPWARRVYLPDGEDARSHLQSGGPAALDNHLRNAEQAAILAYAIRHASTRAQARMMVAEPVTVLDWVTP
jgi:hypothetical protein